MRTWIAQLHSMVQGVWPAQCLRQREAEPSPEGDPVDQAGANSVLRAADVERIAWSARQLGFTARSVLRLETVGLALAAGAPVPIEALSKQPRAVLRKARKHGPRHIVGDSGGRHLEAFVVDISDMALMIAVLLRATPTRYATGAELHRDVVCVGPPYSSAPNPQPQRPLTEEPHDCAPNKTDE